MVENKTVVDLAQCAKGEELSGVVEQVDRTGGEEGEWNALEEIWAMLPSLLRIV